VGSNPTSVNLQIMV